MLWVLDNLFAVACGVPIRAVAGLQVAEIDLLLPPRPVNVSLSAALYQEPDDADDSYEDYLYTRSNSGQLNRPGCLAAHASCR